MPAMASEQPGRLTPLDARGCDILADVLGDSPETLISRHLLKRRRCRAYVAGEPSHFRGAIIQNRGDPGEPMGFGREPDVLWSLLQAARGWYCLNVSAGCAAALGKLMAENLGVAVRCLGDIYHVLSRSAPGFAHPSVRQLTVEDLQLLEVAPAELRGHAYSSLQGMLEEGIAAGAVVSGRLVSIAKTYARTEGHADIGVFTIDGFRRQGFATAAAAIAAARVQEAGQTPVWSAGEHNAASLRVAEKLGFTRVLARTYVIPERGD